MFLISTNKYKETSKVISCHSANHCHVCNKGNADTESETHIYVDSCFVFNDKVTCDMHVQY
jgi:hypothetical protein